MNRIRPLWSVLLGLAACTASPDDLSEDLDRVEELGPQDDLRAPQPDTNEDLDPGRVPVQRFAAADARGESVMIDAEGRASELAPEPARTMPVDPDELAKRAAERDVPMDRISITQRTLDRVAVRPTDESVRLLVSVDAPTLDFTEFRERRGQARRVLIDRRRADLDPVQDRVGKRIEALGGTVLGRRWISSHVLVEIPAGRVVDVAALAEVSDVALDDATTPSAVYDGADIRENTLVEDLLAAGYDSLTGSRSNGRVRVGVIESNGGTNWPTTNHVGWRSWLNSFSRLTQVYACNGSGCSTTTATANGYTHGNAVMWAVGGDITDGQDANIANALSREERSGVAPESSLYYYSDGGNCAGVESALEQALVDGVDVVNMSLGIGAGQCNPDYDCTNQALRNANNAGILVVAAAGNAGHPGTCTLGYPALRNEVLAVGSLSTDTNIDYDAATLLNSSSQGPIATEMHNGLVRDTAGVDLTAPGCYTRHFTWGPNGYNAGAPCGTSMASPIVAGTAANMRDMFDAIGWVGPATDAKALMVNMLLLGDKWDYSTGADRSTGISDTSGFGRMKVHFPTSASLSGPWGWGWRSEVLQQGETKTWTVGSAAAESALVTQFKWAVTWFDNDLDESSDVVIRVYNTCPAGGGAPQYVSGDSGYNLRKSVRLSQSQISGRCLEMRATAYQAPAGGVRIYSADYWHGGDPAEH
ncbi:MAG: S8 family serine peptidase [Myxococcota bacterium]